MAKKAAAAIVAAPLALTAFSAAHDAQAGEPQTASTNTQAEITDEQAIAITQLRRSMRKYSEDPTTQGIGVFINLQADATAADGEKVGEILKNAFATRGIPVEYRTNQSRGTATDITFYVRGYGFTMTLGQLKGNLGEVLAHHRDVWLPEQVSPDNQPQ